VGLIFAFQCRILGVKFHEQLREDTLRNYFFVFDMCGSGMEFEKIKAKTKGITKRDAVLIAFGILDALNFLLFLPRLIRLIYYLCLFSRPPDGLFFESFMFASGLVLVALYVTYPFSAYGFIYRKRWAFLLYYLQFPFRMLLFSTSLGFLSYITKPFQSLTLHYILGIIMLLAESARLAISIVLHKKSVKPGECRKMG
jgi:hypothetical protein